MGRRRKSPLTKNAYQTRRQTPPLQRQLNLVITCRFPPHAFTVEGALSPPPALTLLWRTDLQPLDECGTWPKFSGSARRRRSCSADDAARGPEFFLFILDYVSSRELAKKISKEQKKEHPQGEFLLSRFTWERSLLHKKNTFGSLPMLKGMRWSSVA